MKVLIIEPHGDDSILSGFEILKGFSDKKIEKVDILTCCSRGSDKLEEFGLCSNARFLELNHSEFMEKPTKPTLVNKLYKEGVDLDSYFLDIIRGYDQYKVFEEKVIPEIKKVEDQYDLIAVPLGLIHTDHYILRDLVLREFDHNKIILMEDKPYSEKVYGSKLKESALAKMKLVRDIAKDNRDEDYFVRKFSKAYPTEASMFRFDKEKMISKGIFYSFNKNTLEKLMKVINS